MQTIQLLVLRQITIAHISVRNQSMVWTTDISSSGFKSLTIPDDDIRQCLLYDCADAGARLIGIEYMITPGLFETLAPEERKLWHSHVYEVKSGMLVMPNPTVPTAMWEVAENEEMSQVVELYGKAYHLWQPDKGDKLPIGEPKLMTSYIEDGQLDFEKNVAARDKRFDVDWRSKKIARSGIQSPDIHPGKFKTFELYIHSLISES